MNALLSVLAEHPLMVRAGWMLLHSLWQGTAIALLSWALLRALRTPAARAAAAFGSLVAMLLCLPATWFHLGQVKAAGSAAETPFIEWQSAFTAPRVEHAPEITEDSTGKLPSADRAAAKPVTPPDSTPVPAAEAPREWIGWTACAWLSGILLLGLWRTGGWLQIWRWRTHGVEPATAELRDCLRSAAAKTNVRRTCRIGLSRLVRSPLLCGCWRPVILFPASLLTRLDMPQIEALLIHELTHLRRRDFLLNSVQLIIETLLFYHPAVWWAGRRLRECREHACDDAAVSAGAGPLAYAKTLASLGAQRNAAVVSAGSGSLLARVRRILTGREAPVPAPALTGLLPLLAAFALFSPRLESQTTDAGPAATQEGKAADAARYRYRWQRWGDRGMITDRRGQVMASNVDRWSLLIEPRVVREDYERLTGKAPLQRPAEKPGQPPVDDIPAMVTGLFAASTMPELKELATASPPLAERYARWLRHFNAEVTPWPPAGPVTFSEEQMKRLTDAIKGWRSARIIRTWQRAYPLGARAAQTLGWTRKDSELRGRVLEPAFVQSPEGRHALPETWIMGRSGVEQLMDSSLRGGEWYQNGHFDNERGIVFDNEAPQPGSGMTVRLTLDARMQALSEEALRMAGVGRGAAVVLDVRNGDILALASVPSFDPAIFLDPRPPAIERILKDPTAPVSARALGNYSPGSTFKLVTALAAARAGKSSPSFNCEGVLMVGDRGLRCNGSHGMLNLESAIKHSCNCYFFKLGMDTGITGIAETAGFFGIGGNEAPISGMGKSGFIGTPASEEARNGGKWSAAQTANTSIGQGLVEATPLQMANVAAAVANGGRIWKPRLILDSLPAGTDPAKTPVPEAGTLSVNLLEQGVTPEALETIRRGMWDVVNEPGGTGNRARSALGIAGKTGTALRVKAGDANAEFTTWFLAFAPYEAPRYAVCVVVENGAAGGVTCAPIGRRILEQTVETEKSGKAPVPLRGASIPGHLNKVDSVVYSNDAR